MLELWQRTHVEAAAPVPVAREAPAARIRCSPSSARLPRLAVLVHERDTILSAFTEKSDVFALTFVQHGTFGFIPGEPSASTQPLYGWFLIPVYWIFGRSWESVGLAQLALAIVTCWLVYEIGRRVLGAALGPRRRGDRDAQPVPRSGTTCTSTARSSTRSARRRSCS